MIFLCVREHRWEGACVLSCVSLLSITRQVVWSLELVGDVATLKNLKDQLLTLRLHLLFQSDLYLAHYLGLTWIHTHTLNQLGTVKYIPHMGLSLFLSYKYLILILSICSQCLSLHLWNEASSECECPLLDTKCTLMMSNIKHGLQQAITFICLTRMGRSYEELCLASGCRGNWMEMTVLKAGSTRPWQTVRVASACVYCMCVFMTRRKRRFDTKWLKEQKADDKDTKRTCG